MADFCRSCTIAYIHVDGDLNDLAHLTRTEVVLCEGCGWHHFGPGGVRIHREMDYDEEREGCPYCFGALPEPSSSVAKDAV